MKLLDKEAIVVKIFGTDYPVQVKADPKYVKSVARYVDNKMRQAAKDIPVHSAMKAAIVVALNLADELFKERGEGESVLLDLDDRVKKLSHLLEGELTQISRQ